MMHETLIAGRYRKLNLLGRGGFAQVFLAEDLRLGNRKVALKILSRHVFHDDDRLQKFRQEAEIIGHLTNANTVRAFDYGVDEVGNYYIAMEYVAGETLHQLLRREKALELGRALGVGIQILDALEEAHMLGIIHRDLKPKNIILSPLRLGELVKVLDFGVARILRADDGDEESDEWTLVGTATYMAPEQAQGHPVSPASDLYSVGVMLYHCITGRPPFTSKEDPVAIMIHHATMPPTSMIQMRPDLGIPEEVDQAILRVLSKRPSERFSTASEFRFCLERALEAWNSPDLLTLEEEDMTLSGTRDELLSKTDDELEKSLHHVSLVQQGAGTGSVDLIRRPQEKTDISFRRDDLMEFDPGNTVRATPPSLPGGFSSFSEDEEDEDEGATISTMLSELDPISEDTENKVEPAGSVLNPVLQTALELQSNVPSGSYQILDEGRAVGGPRSQPTTPLSSPPVYRTEERTVNENLPQGAQVFHSVPPQDWQKNSKWTESTHATKNPLGVLSPVDSTLDTHGLTVDQGTNRHRKKPRMNAGLEFSPHQMQQGEGAPENSSQMNTDIMQRVSPFAPPPKADMLAGRKTTPQFPTGAIAAYLAQERASISFSESHPPHSTEEVTEANLSAATAESVPSIAMLQAQRDPFATAMDEEGRATQPLSSEQYHDEKSTGSRGWFVIVVVVMLIVGGLVYVLRGDSDEHLVLVNQSSYQSAVEKGKEAEEQGDYQQAYLLFREALMHRPKDPAAEAHLKRTALNVAASGSVRTAKTWMSKGNYIAAYRSLLPVSKDSVFWPQRQQLMRVMVPVLVKVVGPRIQTSAREKRWGEAKELCALLGRIQPKHRYKTFCRRAAKTR